MSIAEPVDQIQVLRLHTDNRDRVWYGCDSSIGCDSELSVSEFLQPRTMEFDVSRIPIVKLLGLRQNSKLLMQLQTLRLSSLNTSQLKKSAIILGSPAICRTGSKLSDPETVLRYLWQSESNLSWQWHTMRAGDFCSFALIEALHEHGEGEISRGRAFYHPAWPAVSFIPQFDADAACRLLATIVDPRWYVHYTHPHRISKLMAYLGLTPQNIKAYLGKGNPGLHFMRAADAVSLWYNGQSLKIFEVEFDSPAYFLWRIYALQSDPIKGILKATELLISFIYHVWLYAVSPAHPEVGFDPFLFFRREIEAKAFVGHLRSSRKV